MEVVRGSDRTALVLVLALLAVVGFALYGRVTGAPPAGSEATGTSSPRGTGTDTAADRAVDVATPRAAVFWYRSALLPVEGRAGEGVDGLVAVVDVSGEEIGRANLAVDPDGGFAGLVQVVPPVRRSEATLRLYEDGDADRPLASVRYPIQAGSSILLWSPTPNTEVAAGEVLTVAGPVLGAVSEVHGVLRNDEGALIAEGRVTVAAPAASPAVGDTPETFELRLQLPTDRTGSATLHVFAKAPGTGQDVAHLDVRLTILPPRTVGFGDGAQPPR